MHIWHYLTAMPSWFIPCWIWTKCCFSEVWDVVQANSVQWGMKQHNNGQFSSYGWLVGGFNPSEKYEFVSWGCYSQLNGKIKMFQTTNQLQLWMIYFEQVHAGFESITAFPSPGYLSDFKGQKTSHRIHLVFSVPTKKKGFSKTTISLPNPKVMAIAKKGWIPYSRGLVPDIPIHIPWNPCLWLLNPTLDHGTYWLAAMLSVSVPICCWLNIVKPCKKHIFCY